MKLVRFNYSKFGIDIEVGSPTLVKTSTNDNGKGEGQGESRGSGDSKGAGNGDGNCAGYGDGNGSGNHFNHMIGGKKDEIEHYEVSNYEAGS